MTFYLRIRAGAFACLLALSACSTASTSNNPPADSSDSGAGGTAGSAGSMADAAEIDAGDDASDDVAVACDVPVVPGTWIGQGTPSGFTVSGKIIAGGRQPAHEADLGNGLHREMDGALQGADVKLLALDGTVLANAKTGCGGRYVLPAPAFQKVLTLVEAVAASDGGYTGFLLAREMAGTDLENYDMDMIPVSELTERLAAIGQSYDATRGWVIQSLATTSLNGGEGVDVTGAPAEGYFSVTGTHTIAGKTLPAACPPGTQGVTPGDPLMAPDGGVICYTDLLQTVFVAGVQPGTTTSISLLSPPGETCKMRIDPGAWVVIANTVTRVFADCGP